MKEQIAESHESNALLITIDEAARRLSIGRSHIYMQIQLGRLRSVRIGRSRRILESDLAAFIEELLDEPNRGGYPVDPVPRGSTVKTLPLRRGRR